MRSVERVLVTGGAGFIGSHLVERLVQTGACVTVLDDLATGHRTNLNAVSDRIEWREAELRYCLKDGTLDLSAFTHIFHLAANPYIPPSVENPRFDFELNLLTTFELLETLRGMSAPPCLINVSSAAVYGNPVHLPMREDDPTFPISPYGVSKLAAERYAVVYSQLYGLPISSARFLSIYGPRQHKQVVFDLIRKLRANAHELVVLGDGTQARDFTYVGDAVTALMVIAERAAGKGEVYNVGSGQTYTIRELVETLCRVLNLAPKVTYTGRTRLGETERWEVDITRLSGLGYAPRTTFEEGLRATCEWYDTLQQMTIL